ncbi:uroporphyrinogen decarboxylase family protein [Candidatus Formimonas warabiya]|uniref:Uroporphyrinogen decarboxylase (URO-D) domain-containing protein n=1 Tax=Formimonas warabiya TaxID=1761012 RepID=A0A3G1KQJ5_FORW1|nr:uroporphyrinogen decarboxylase family protein [Candidatus Formimonas warabiya]ATW24395.1 hypothetical protein DCMF_06000 [Candidatus Formimonas warabiya]
MVEFKCPGHNQDPIPEEALKEAGVTFPNAYTDKNEIAALATVLKKYRDDVFTRVPFCVTVEAEAFGAQIKMGDAWHRPRPHGRRFSSIEDLSGIQTPDISEGRMGEVLDAVAILAESGEKVILNIVGPFTILYSLINFTFFYNGLRKNPAQVREIMAVIEKSVIQYGMEGVKRGASIISYEDAVGVPDVTGPEIYQDFSGPSSLRIINGIKEAGGTFLIHLCGRTSAALENTGMVRSYTIKAGKALTYDQALERLLDKLTQPIVVGHKCIAWGSMKMDQSLIWGIKLN